MRVQHSRETISIRDIPAGDDFVAGAKLAMADNNTTGGFLDQTFTVEDVKLTPDEDAVAAAKKLLDSGVRYLIVDLPADKLLQVADAARDAKALVFNGGAPDESCTRGGLPLQPDPHRPLARDARGRARAVSNLEEVAEMVARRRLAS